MMGILADLEEQRIHAWLEEAAAARLEDMDEIVRDMEFFAKSDFRVDSGGAFGFNSLR